MKTIKMKMLTTAALLTLTLKAANGLRCYTCNSHFDPLCGDPFFDHLGEVTIFPMTHRREIKTFLTLFVHCGEKKMIKDVTIIVSAGEERGQIWTGMPTWVWANCLLQVHRYTGTLKFLGRLGLFLNSRNLRKDLVSSRVNISGKVLDLVTPWNGVAAGRRRWERSFGRIGRREIFQYIPIFGRIGEIFPNLIWTQVGGLGKWLARYLGLLHTSHHGEDVRVLLRYCLNKCKLFLIWLFR